MTTCLILTRAVHIGACMLFFGVYVFDWVVASALPGGDGGIAGYWKTRLRVFCWILPPVIVVSGMTWFALVAMTMSGQPLGVDVLKVVWAQTQFGAVSKIRLIFLAVATILTCFQRSAPEVRQFAAWVQTLATGCLLGSLAWAGHGQEGPRWHLVADVVHLLAAGVWPVGLLPLLLLMGNARRAAAPQDWPFMSIVVNRFSTVSLIAVLVLVMTGIANAIYLVGSFSNLIDQPYGRWLLAKSILFCLALAIAVVNLFGPKPRLIVEKLRPEKAAATTAELQRNVQFELLLGIGIVAVVAVLGILPPAI